MARMRKSARLWRDPAARAQADSALVTFAPALAAFEPEQIFARKAALEIELGSGKGDLIIERARSTPERNFLAVELAASVLRLLATRIGRSGLENLKAMRIDGRTLVNLMVEPASVSAYHIYFPDPWPKERHVKHRLFTPFFVATLARTLEPRGLLYFATDVADYAEVIFAMLEGAGFSRLSASSPGAQGTNFGRKYAAVGRPVYAGTFAPPSAAPAEPASRPEAESAADAGNVPR